MKTLHFGIIVVVTLAILITSHTVFAFAPDIVVQTASFNGNQGTYAIPYNITNGTLVASLLDLPAKELIFTFNTTGDGKLTAELPRKIIDSTRDGKDKPYLVFVGNSETNPKRIKANEIQIDNKTRTLEIDYTKRDNQIGIVGTYFIENNSTSTGWNPFGAFTPLQQYNKGFDAQDIVCKQDLHLIIKSEDGSPACVKPDTAEKLVLRGWTQSRANNPQTSITIPPDYTNKTASIIPGHLHRSTCGGPAPAYQSSSRIINNTGFIGVYHDTMRYYANPDDYVLEPGHTGIITYEIDAGPTPKPVPISPIKVPKNFNITNYAIFYHEITSLEELAKHPGVTIHDNQDYKACFTRPTGDQTCIGEVFGGKRFIEAYVTDHPGVNATFNPSSEALQFNDVSLTQSSQIITLTITSDENAQRGTYMVWLSPEDCRGGEMFLLTIGEQPYHE